MSTLFTLFRRKERKNHPYPVYPVFFEGEEGYQHSPRPLSSSQACHLSSLAGWTPSSTTRVPPPISHSPCPFTHDSMEEARVHLLLGGHNLAPNPFHKIKMDFFPPKFLMRSTKENISKSDISFPFKLLKVNIKSNLRVTLANGGTDLTLLQSFKFHSKLELERQCLCCASLLRSYDGGTTEEEEEEK